VENLVGYAKRDLMVPLSALGAQITDLAAANEAAAAWCTELNAARHSEIAAVPAERLAQVEAGLLASLPSLLPAGLFGGRRELRKVDKLSCVRFGSARYSVPSRLLGHTVEVLAGPAGVTIVAPGTGEVLAEHPLMAPGEASVLDAHYGRPRPNAPARKVTPRTAAELAFCALEGRSRSSGCAARPRPGTPASGQSSPSSLRSRPRTAATRSWRRWSGRSRSAGGAPVASARFWPPAPGSRSPPLRVRRW